MHFFPGREVDMSFEALSDHGQEDAMAEADDSDKPDDRIVTFFSQNLL